LCYYFKIAKPKDLKVGIFTTFYDEKESLYIDRRGNDKKGRGNCAK